MKHGAGGASRTPDAASSRDVDGEEIADLLSEIGRAFKARLRSLPDSPAKDLSLPQRDVLKMIGRRPGVTPAQIGERMGRDRAQITRLVSELQEMGLIERTRSTQDRRSVVLNLSPDGTALFARMLKRRAGLSQIMLSDLTDTETQTLKSLLQRLRGTLKGPSIS
ncbi:MarR family transcriptional regulator [Aureimonas sp. SK2]|uniref:MarR family winged helix-turn-helix transcriptional regulator n=1 Tax=Aureimonas sp. SK2 TaxID=3015992 RepID=UPI00244539D3|nr:MarR family transcriptional regulator [Aureimonas sp. SK2]